MSADDNAPEQAREVEVVARVVRSVPLGPLGPVALSIAGTDTFLANYSEADAIAEAVLAALAPVRTAERQEAARAAVEAIDPFLLEQKIQDAYSKLEPWQGAPPISTSFPFKEMALAAIEHFRRAVRP